ncbi:hypothetical protein Tco_0567400 [Tanacetum coccineum]
MVDFVPGRAVIDAAQRKRGKYTAKCASIGYVFLPFSFSSFGELESDAVTLLKRIRKFSMAQVIGARDISQVSNRRTKVTAKPKSEQQKYGDEQRADGQDADSDGCRFRRMQTDEIQIQNKQNRVEPKHVVDAEMLHITTQDAVGFVKTITSPSPTQKLMRWPITMRCRCRCDAMPDAMPLPLHAIPNAMQIANWQ